MRSVGDADPGEFSVQDAEAADCAAFPGAPLPVSAARVAAGASGRSFFRIYRGGETRILMAYPPEPAENLLFAPIGKTLALAGIPVPEVLANQSDKGLVWLEDLGDRDLFSQKKDPSARLPAYEKAIGELHRIQGIAGDYFLNHGVNTLPAFDEDLYQFEQRYFEKELVARVLPQWEADAAFAHECTRLRRFLLSGVETWVHRDFQSKNLMLDSENRLRIVDFQGIRRGHRYYDLASLLCDPYVALPREERETLFQTFCRGNETDPERERTAFRSACVQRLMQASGAYGRFGLGRGVTFFREKIPLALFLLREAAEDAGFPAVAKVTGDLLASLDAG